MYDVDVFRLTDSDRELNKLNIYIILYTNFSIYTFSSLKNSFCNPEKCTSNIVTDGIDYYNIFHISCMLGEYF